MYIKDSKFAGQRGGATTHTHKQGLGWSHLRRLEVNLVGA